MNNCKENPPVRLAITLGDINGVGPEILAKALEQLWPAPPCPLVVFGDIRVLESMRRFAPLMPELYGLDSLDGVGADNRGIPVFDAGCTTPLLQPGKLDPEAGRCAAAWIEAAAKAALAGKVQGMVTCPVNKEGMLLSGCPYPGHTPMLAALTGTKECHMSLFADRMRIAHITAHLSMADAVKAVTKERVLRAIEAGHSVLKRLGISSPRIAVAGLNPHAGEAGTFGSEEINEIVPAIEAALQQGIPCCGPVAPDTVFQRMYNGEFDLVVAMYHDQGHIPFKLVAMDEGVHATLGLPFIRTSPDHGTAFDIAGTGAARSGSMCAAIRLAAQWMLHATEGQA